MKAVLLKKIEATSKEKTINAGRKSKDKSGIEMDD